MDERQCITTHLNYRHYMDKNILQAGIDAITQAISESPTAILYKERGRLRMLSGDSEGAMEDIQKAAELDSSFLEELNGRFDIK